MNLSLIKTFFEFGYLLSFAMMALAVFFIHFPNEKGMESYRKARVTLGSSLLTLSLYCILSLLVIRNHTEYVDFWMLVTFTLVHSWLTYSTMLFLLETPRFRIIHFLIDGATPTSLMIICGIAGLIYPATQKWMQIAFGCIFGLKCAYMFYVCLREYSKCEKELNNYYDETPDIKWIRNLIFLSLFMSVITVVAFYVTKIHLIYYLSIPVIYAYIVARTINFAPKKIDAIRKKNVTMDKPAETEPKKSQNLEDKVGPKVEEWVSDKNYCEADLNIKDVAMAMGTNHNYLSQYLNNNLGMTFQVWLNTLRIEEAKQILTNGEKISIEEVGIQVGIPQSYNFSRWFRTVTGTTPYQYRKHN